MNDTEGDAATAVRRIEIGRFPDWRALRDFALREARNATPDRSVALVVPTEGAVWVLDRFLRSELPIGTVAPSVLTAARAFGDLLDDLPNETPAGGTPASRLLRETLLEESLAEGAGAPGAPPGAPELLAEPLLAFLDEQAADRSVTPVAEAAFDAFCDRVESRFSEERETDEGAARLAALTGWLRGVVRRYRKRLRERGELDPDGVRRELVRRAEAVGAAPRWARVVALGEGALAPADLEVFAAVGPPEGLAWALPPGAPEPGLPPSVRPIPLRSDGAPGADRVAPPAGDCSGSLFAPAGSAEPLSVFAPEPGAGEAAAPVAAPDADARVFVVTDRDDEVERAARLLEAFRDAEPERFRGFDRCAIVAQRPALYLPAAEAVFAGAGIPFRSPEAMPLVAGPRAAGLGDLLDFAERPERLSRGLTLLRNPFLTGPDLPADLPRCADLAERSFVRFGLRDTVTAPSRNGAAPAPATSPGAATASESDPPDSDPPDSDPPDSDPPHSDPIAGVGANLTAIAGRFREAVDEFESLPEDQKSRRKRGEAEEDSCAAAVLDLFARWADDLARFRDPEADFRAAVSTIVEFARRHLSPEASGREVPESAAERTSMEADRPPGAPDTEDAEGTEDAEDAEEESAIVALAQAADFLGGVPSGGRERVAALLRRMLLRRRAPRRRADEGVQLLRAADAPFGDFDGVVFLGLSDADWPGPRPSNIFYPRSLLEEATRVRHADRRGAEIRLLRAFAELPLRAAAFVRAAHEDGFPAGVSPFEVELREALDASGARRRIFAPPPAEASAESGDGAPPPPLPEALDRRAPSAKALERTLSPTALDRYAGSPAEFFARNVLFLDEERPLSDIAAPTERGLLLHEILERGIPRLHEAGLRLEADPDRALDLLDDTLREIGREWKLPNEDLRSEHLWLFGHAAEPGTLEWFLREQAAQGPFEPRCYEKDLAAEIEPATATAPPLRVAGRADRVDTLGDGRLRVLEYKSGRFFAKPLQARLYARILEAHRSVDPRYGIAYCGDRRWVGPEDKPSDSDQDDTIRAVRDGLAAGEFGLPADPPAFGMPLVSRHDLPDAAAESAEPAAGGPARNPLPPLR